MRIGLIGAGEHVRSIHLPVLHQISGITLEWLYDIDLRRAKELAKANGIPVAASGLRDCPDVDAVLLAVPVGARMPIWEHIFQRGWHVLCEKPVARSVEEFDWISANLTQAGRIWQPGLMRRFYAGTLLLRRLVRDRVFGDLVEVWAGEGGRQTRTGRGGDWYQLDRSLAGGGILIETGSHLLDQILFITGAHDVFLEEYQQEPRGLTLEYDARVLGRLAQERGEMPFSCVLSRTQDICNGIYLRFERLVVALEHGADGAVGLRDLQNLAIAPLGIAGVGARSPFGAFHAEWVDFVDLCRSGDFAAAEEANALTRLSVRTIEKCYRTAAGSSMEAEIAGVNTTGGGA